jgi:hypothetical protein
LVHGAVGDYGNYFHDDHTDISEATECSDAQRPTFVDGRTANTVDNSSGKSTFNIDADGTTVEGAFLISSEDFGSTEGICFPVVCSRRDEGR